MAKGMDERTEFEIPPPEECDHRPVLKGGSAAGSGAVTFFQCPTCGKAVVKQVSSRSDGTVLFGGWNAPEKPGLFDRVKSRLGRGE